VASFGGANGNRLSIELPTFKDVHPEGLRKLEERIHDMFWKTGRINAQILSDDSA
jgi:hypothetical protein